MTEKMHFESKHGLSPDLINVPYIIFFVGKMFLIILIFFYVYELHLFIVDLQKIIYTQAN